jgi:hypothetical protein
MRYGQPPWVRLRKSPPGLSGPWDHRLTNTAPSRDVGTVNNTTVHAATNRLAIWSLFYHLCHMFTGGRQNFLYWMNITMIIKEEKISQ